MKGQIGFIVDQLCGFNQVLASGRVHLHTVDLTHLHIVKNQLQHLVLVTHHPVPDQQLPA